VGFQGQRSVVEVMCVQTCESYQGGDVTFDGIKAHLLPNITEQCFSLA